VLQLTEFREFWLGVKVIDNKWELIQLYEVGLSRLLYQHSFESSVLVNYQPTMTEKSACVVNWLIPMNNFWLVLANNFVRLAMFPIIWRTNPNISVMCWDRLIRGYRMPFMKKSLFFVPSYNTGVLRIYAEVVRAISSYPVELIEDFIGRHEKTRDK
jgi:hypothetical protein